MDLTRASVERFMAMSFKNELMGDGCLWLVSYGLLQAKSYPRRTMESRKAQPD
ncbi:MAG: hypothetical protein RI949_1941 [Pseudomonadota bacterium]|jgi:hypothetical protein